MNCTSYVFGNIERYFQYPDDYTSNIFQSAAQMIIAPNQLVIHRDNNLMYYIYLQQLKYTHYVGICIVLNGAMITNIAGLFHFFKKKMDNLSNTLGITGTGNFNQGHIDNKHTEIKSFLSYMHTISLETSMEIPPVDLRFEKKSRMNFLFNNNSEEIVNASAKYSDIVVYKEFKTEEKIVDERNFSECYCDILYSFLQEVCEPSRYMNPYNAEKIRTANNIYGRLDTLKGNLSNLIIARKNVKEVLNVEVTSTWLYDQLSAQYNPYQYTGENYNLQKLEFANNVFEKIQKAKNDATALEDIATNVGLLKVYTREDENNEAYLFIGLYSTPQN